jgi:hypothetical protein
MIQRLNTAYLEINELNVLKRVASFLLDMESLGFNYKNITKEKIEQIGYKDILFSFGDSVSLESFISANEQNLSIIEMKILAIKAVKNPNDEVVLNMIASRYNYTLNAYNVEHQHNIEFIPIDPFAVKRAIICKDLPSESLAELVYHSIRNKNFGILCTAGGHKVKRKEIDYLWEGKGRPKL